MTKNVVDKDFLDKKLLFTNLVWDQNIVNLQAKSRLGDLPMSQQEQQEQQQEEPLTKIYQKGMC